MSSENQPPAKKIPERLPSLRGLRDLTLKDAGLGKSVAPAKKRTFTPVLPSQTKPKVQTEFVSEFEPPPELKVKPGFVRSKPNHADSGRGSGRGRGRGRGQEQVDDSQFVQMKSVFAEGPMQRMDAYVKSGFASSYGSSRDRQSMHDGGGGGGGRGGVSNKMKAHKEEDISVDCKEDVASILDDLLRDDFIADQSNVNGDPAMAPVFLPLSDSVKGQDALSTLQKDVKAKQDTVETMDVDIVKLDSDSKKGSDIFEISSARNDELMLFQLPDTLPGIPFEKALQSKDSNSDQKFLLSEFEESCVGQIVVRRSGKTQLVLNDVVFDVVLGTKSTFLQELVSLQVEDVSADRGILSVLGHVRHKLLCVPDLDQLLITSHNSNR